MIKQEIRELLPEKMQCAMIRCHGNLYSFSYYLEKYEISNMMNMSSGDFVEYISKKYDKYVFTCTPDKYFRRVMHELQNKEDYEEKIRISNDEYIDVYERLSFLFALANDDFLIPIGDEFKTIYEVYENLKNNKYVELTDQDKIEICEYLLNGIDDSIRKSIIEEMNMTVEDYIISQLPKMMINTTEIEVSGEKVEITEVVKRIVDLQYTRLINIEEELNRTKENPSLVTEIYVEMDKADALEATLDIPIVLSDEEINSFDIGSDFSNQEQYYIKQVRRLIDAIKNVSNKDSLENLINELEKLNEVIKAKSLSPYINDLINVAYQDVIPVKERELFKFKNNSEDYIDATMGRIHKLREKVVLYETETELLEIETELEKLDYEIGKRMLSDKEFSEANITLMEVRMLLDEKKNTSLIIPSSQILSRFLEKIIELKKILINIEYNSNKAEIVGYSIKFESSKADFINEMSSSLENGLLNQSEYDVLINKLNDLENLENKAIKSKGGI